MAKKVVSLLPNDIEAEEALLGSLIIDGDLIHEAASVLQPSDFFREANRWIFEACLSLQARREAITQITLAAQLESKGQLEDIGGHGRLSHYVAQTPTSVFATDYARVVARCALRRRVIGASGRIAQMAHDDGGDSEILLSKAISTLTALKTLGHVSIVGPNERADDAIAILAARDGGNMALLATGLRDLDRDIGGMALGEMVLVAGRPGLGKSTVIQQIAHNLATNGQTVLLASAEMSVRQYTERELAMRAAVPIEAVIKGTLTDEAWDAVQEAVALIHQHPLYITAGRLTTDIIAARAQDLQRQRGLSCVCVDYLQLLADDGRSDNERVGAISRNLKQLAVDLNVVVLAASQLNREPERRDDRRPKLSDLRDSGSLEQDADVVLFLHRDDAYFDEDAWSDTRMARRGKPYQAGLAELGIAKHRQLGSRRQVVKLVWDGRSRQYRDYTPRVS
jgi:replicative DNA helicase